MLFTVVLAVGLGQALAFPQYRMAAIKQLHLAADAPNKPWTITCQYCHVKPEGGDPWNPFGIKVQTQVAIDIDINKAIYNVLKAKFDSDGDGYVDMLEVFAGTLPGNKDSRPLVDIKYLQQAFDKAGGVDQYKP